MLACFQKLARAHESGHGKAVAISSLLAQLEALMSPINLKPALKDVRIQVLMIDLKTMYTRLCYLLAAANAYSRACKPMHAWKHSN